MYHNSPPDDPPLMTPPIPSFQDLAREDKLRPALGRLLHALNIKNEKIVFEVSLLDIAEAAAREWANMDPTFLNNMLSTFQPAEFLWHFDLGAMVDSYIMEDICQECGTNEPNLNAGYCLGCYEDWSRESDEVDRQQAAEEREPTPQSAL